MSGLPTTRRVLGNLRARLAAWLALRTALLVVGVLALAVLAGVAADAVVVLADATRAAWPIVLAIAALAVIAAGLWSMLRLTDGRMARALEQGDPELGTALTNAVQLGRRDGDRPVERLLIEQAVARGRERATGLRAFPMVRPTIVGAGGLLGAAALAWMAGVLVVGDVFDAVLPRFLDPYGDHPPYSRVRIVVEPEDAAVLYAGQLEIHARTEGPPPERLYLVAEDQAGRTQTVMFRRPDRSHFQTLTNLREPTRFWVTDGRARSYRHQIDIRYTPRIERVDVQHDYPDYTRLASRTRELAEDELRVPRHTRLTFRAISNRPLASGQLELTPLLGGRHEQLELAVDADNPHAVAGSLTVTEPVAFSLTVTDTDGLPSSGSRRGRVTIEPNRRPQITVLEPGRHAFATPEVVIPVHVRAEDQYAVEELIKFRGLNRSIERPVDLDADEVRGPGVVEARGGFNLGDLGVRPGDEIEYFFEAVDNDPDGPNVATSRIYSLRIISEEQYARVLRERAARQALFEQYARLNQQMRRLAEQAEMLRRHADDLAEQGGGSEAEQAELRQRAAALDEAMANLDGAMQDALDTRQLFDVEEAFREFIAEHREQLADARQQLEQAGGGSPGSGTPGGFDPDALADLADRLAEMAGQVDRDIGQPAEQIAVVTRLVAMADEFVRLAQQQEELARLARRFEDNPGPFSRLEQAELRELADAQGRIRDDVDSYRSRLEERVDDLPDDEQFDQLRSTAEGFLEAFDEADIDEDLDASTDKLTLLDGPGGYPRAQSAADKMDALIARCEAMGDPQQAQECLIFQPQIARAMGMTIQQILNAMSAGGGTGPGYALLGDNAGLYGPDAQLTGEQEGGAGEFDAADAVAGGSDTTGETHDAADEPAPVPTAGPGRVRLQQDGRFPLRYRDLVGDYFRAIAETE